MRSRHLTSALPLALLASCAATGATRDVAASERGMVRSAWTERLTEPVSAFTTFESPSVHTSVRPIVMHHELPSDSIFMGGDVQLYAVQARYAVNERFAIIATKDGFIDLNPDAGSSETGLADIAAGVKYVAYEDAEQGLVVTPGLIYETSSGDEEVFQGNGDGVLRPFVTAGLDRGETDVLASFGFNQPLDDDAESTSFDYHLHLSHEVAEGFRPLVELNGIQYVSSGSALAADFEGGDLINLGASNVAGNTVVTGAIGARYYASDDILLGLTYEWPLTAREDLIDSRITLDLLYLF